MHFYYNEFNTLHLWLLITQSMDLESFEYNVHIVLAIFITL